MTFPIERGIPIPPRRPFANGPKYPWLSMQPGDSFFVPGAKIRNMSSTAYVAGRRHNMKFQAQREADGVRVWRVS